MPTQPSTPIALKPRMNVVAQYLLVLAAVIGCYSGYVKFAVPMIEGPPIPISRRHFTPLAELPSPQVQKSYLIPLLPAGAWELTDCKTLLTDSGTILFKELLPLDDGTILIEPFTLITGLEHPTPGKSPIGPPKKTPKPTVLRCVEGAKLKFDKPMREVLSGRAKMKSARLAGQVEIYGPPSQPGQNDAMHVLTSNVQIDKQRIFTLDKVSFSFGSNRGSGRNMLIDLTHKIDAPTAADFSNIQGIRRLELAFLESLRIEPSVRKETAVAVGQTEPPTQPAKKSLFTDRKSPLEIKCAGPFVFDFEALTATFQDDVFVEQIDAFRDNIKCQKLTLIFEDKPDNPPGDSETKANPAKPDDSLSSDFQLKQFVATGTPAVVVSRSRSAKFSADYLSYHVATNKIAGRCNPESERLVTIVSPEYQLVAKQLSYLIQDDESMGPINATGPGRLLIVGNEKQDEVFTTWQKSLISSRVPEQPGLQRVVLDGKPKIRIADDTLVDADRLELLVWQLPTVKPHESPATKHKWDYFPAKLFANGNITVASPKLDGRAQNLTATWLERPVNLSRLPRAQKRSMDSHVVAYRGIDQRKSSNTASRNSGSFVEQTGSFRNSGTFREQPNEFGSFREQTVQQAGLETDAKPSQKLTFEGETVDIQLVGTGNTIQVLDLTIVGNVSIIGTPTNQTKTNRPGSQPFKISGHRLQLTPQSGKDIYRTLVSGKNGGLATVNSKDFELKGQNINLDQAANKLWVEGTGSIKLKTDPATNEPPKTVQVNDDKNEAAMGNLDVAWQGGMIFDGTKIYFERDVVMSAERTSKNGDPSTIKSQCEGLSVELKQPVNFQKLQSNQKIGNAEARELVFVDHLSADKRVFKTDSHVSQTARIGKRPVVIENLTFDSAGKLAEKQKIIVSQAVVDPVNRSIRSKGPGSLATHRLGKPSSEKSGNPLGRLGQIQNKTGLSFIQVNFDGDMSIDAESSQMKLSGNIRTIYAPVQSWQEEFDPDENHLRSPGKVFLTCEQLEMAQWSPRSNDQRVNEMLATGNAHIFSDTFEVTSDRVSYDQDSDWLTIEGSPRTDANLWFKQTPNDKEPTHLVAEKIKYRLKDQMTETQGVKNLSINRK